MATKWDCLDLGGEWSKKFMNFDSIAEAIYSLFIISNAVSWSETMYIGAGSLGVDMIPTTELQSYLTPFFFVLTIIIGNFFIMNLFVGVIITTYNREKELLGKDFMLTQK